MLRAFFLSSNTVFPYFLVTIIIESSKHHCVQHTKTRHVPKFETRAVHLHEVLEYFASCSRHVFCWLNQCPHLTCRVFLKSSLEFRSSRYIINALTMSPPWLPFSLLYFFSVSCYTNLIQIPVSSLPGSIKQSSNFFSRPELFNSIKNHPCFPL